MVNDMINSRQVTFIIGVDVLNLYCIYM